MGSKKSKQSTGITDAQIKLLENNTGMSREEIQQWYRQFMTDYPDGSIDQKEFADIFRKTYPHGKPEKYAKIAFKAFDVDKNGKITFEEFLLSTSFAIQGHVDKRKAIDFAFDIYDSDNNGKITKKEMEQMIAALYEITGQDAKTAKAKVAEVLNKYDLDRNGSLNKQEFVDFIISDPICAQVFHL